MWPEHGKAVRLRSLRRVTTRHHTAPLTSWQEAATGLSTPSPTAGAVPESLSYGPDAGSQGRASGTQLGPKSLNIPILQVGKEGKQVQKRGYVPGHFTMK